MFWEFGELPIGPRLRLQIRLHGGGDLTTVDVEAVGRTLIDIADAVRAMRAEYDAVIAAPPPPKGTP